MFYRETRRLQTIFCCRKNNEAAKRSRDARRAKEYEVSIRCQFLERENQEKNNLLAAKEAENIKLREDLARTQELLRQMEIEKAEHRHRLEHREVRRSRSRSRSPMQ